MESKVHCEVSTGQIDVAPRLVYDRAFIPEGDLPENQNVRDEVIRKLNYAIAYDPVTMLEDLAWLDAQLDGDEPIEARPFIHLKEKKEVDGWAAQRPYIGTVRDVLGITNNGSQFAFGETPAQSDEGWQTVLNKCNEVDKANASAAQARVHETSLMLRRAKQQASTPKEELEFWEQQHTIAKQKRAIMRLRSLALITRGPQADSAEVIDGTDELPDTETLPPQRPGALSRVLAVGKTLATFSFTL